ncbi:MAG: glycosyltransferase, partial [Selenomonadaceae bacterium]|nr:glycosyltransferase [Selenomonadaceae bacterium]
MNCGLIIPTLNAGEQFRTLLEQIAAQSLPTQKLVVDSESTDGTAELAKSFGVEVLTIPRKT